MQNTKCEVCSWNSALSWDCEGKRGCQIWSTDVAKYAEQVLMIDRRVPHPQYNNLLLTLLSVNHNTPKGFRYAVVECRYFHMAEIRKSHLHTNDPMENLHKPLYKPCLWIASQVFYSLWCLVFYFGRHYITNFVCLLWHLDIQYFHW